MDITARLSVLEPSGKRHEIAVERVPFTIGRQAENDLVLRDSRVSRRQSQIEAEQDRFVVVDLESRHGTFVNGQRINRHVLQPNDKIEFGVADSYAVIFSTDQPTVGKLLDRMKSGATESQKGNELHHLSAILEVGRVLQMGMPIDAILTQVVDSSLQIAGAERGFLLLKDARGEMNFRVARDKNHATLGKDAMRLSQTVVNQALRTRMHVIHTDVNENANAALVAQSSVLDLELRTIICLPLTTMNVGAAAPEATVMGTPQDVIGVLYMDSRKPTSVFSETSRAMLQNLCMEASAVVENARLLAEGRDRERLRQELDIARDIQQRLLPRKMPDNPRVTISGQTIACYSVGGDFYDVFDLGEGRCGIVVCDVSGKGISAALLASMLQGVFWATAQAFASPAEVVHRVNSHITERSVSDKYATLFYGVLEPNGTITYVNAGHNPGLVVSPEGKITTLDSDNLPVGLFDTATYAEKSAAFTTGSQLVLYTDGVTEANNTSDEMFGDEGLQDLLRLPGGESEATRDRVLQAVRRFAAGAAQSDDITVIVAKHN